MPLFVKGAVSVLYIHVPKTGGTSIEHLFQSQGFRSEFLDAGPQNSFNKYRKCSPQHLHAEPLLALLRPGTIDFTFMTVRHPFSRLLSEYKMRVRIDREPLPLCRWLDRVLKRYVETPHLMDNHFRPQSEFVIPGCDVFRQEDGFGATFLERLEQRTGMTLSDDEAWSITHHNRDTGLHVEQAEIDRARPIVEQFYRQDYATFGYPPTP